MKRRHRITNRRPRIQTLDRRCVMDAEGLDLPITELATIKAETTDVADAFAETAGDIVTMTLFASDESFAIEDSEFSPEIFESMHLRASVMMDAGWISFDGGASDDELMMTASSSDTLDEDMSLSILSEETVVGELSPEIFQTTSVPAEGDRTEELDAFMTRIEDVDQTMDFDVNANGNVTALDALLIINSMGRRRSMALQAQGESQAMVASATESNLDVNKDTLVTPLDALLVINHVGRSSRLAEDMSVGDESIDGQAFVDKTALLEEAVKSAKSLALADIGSYGVMLLELSEDGKLTVTADGEVIVATVNTDGTIAAGDLDLPARLYTAASGEQGLFSEFDPLLDLDPGQGLAEGDEVMGSRLAGATVLTVVGASKLPLVVSVNEDGSISAIEGGQTKAVVVGEDEFLMVDGIRLPIRLLKSGDEVYMVPDDNDLDGIDVSWPVLVDEVFAELT